VVGVLATSPTLASARYARLAATYAAAARILPQPCPGLVDRVEEGDLESAATRALVARYVKPLVEEGADTLVLGCTHYPFLRDVIVQAAGPEVTILESAAPVAKQLRRRLEAVGVTELSGAEGKVEFWTTGDRGRVGGVMSRLLGVPVVPESVPEPWASSGASD
jgi:glutamate racemase